MKHGAAMAAVVGVASAYALPPLALSPYAPVQVPCPSGSLNRQASGINSLEAAYITQRQMKASSALASWIQSVDSSFNTSAVPALGFAASGGGFRAMLCAGGVIQGFDSRDSNLSTSGIFQGLTYIAGLSGGSWFLSSLAANDWPTISNLSSTLWTPNLETSLLVPSGYDNALEDPEITYDLGAKVAAGFPVTIPDIWGRLLSYTLLDGYDAGVKDTWSGMTKLSNFTSWNVPFPIVTALGVQPGQCDIMNNNTQYEFNPYEFGSWDPQVNAFTNINYLGTSQSNGKPSTSTCISNFDNTGLILGTSSNIFGEVCEDFPGSNDTLTGVMEDILQDVETLPEDDTYAFYPNPFYQSSGSPLVESQQTLHLVDGGLGGQNDPIWPFIQNNTRDLDVLIVSDNSADTDGHLPDGSEIYDTWLRAKQLGLHRMPEIPPSSTFLAEGLNERATFFGCHHKKKLTIVWIPNVPYSFASNTSTEQLQYSPSQTAAMLANGNLIATQNGTMEWPNCLACVMQKKTGTTLPSYCKECFHKYCYHPRLNATSA